MDKMRDNSCKKTTTGESETKTSTIHPQKVLWNWIKTSVTLSRLSLLSESWTEGKWYSSCMRPMHKTCIRNQNWTIDRSNMPESYTVSSWKLRGFLCKHYSFTKLSYMPISTFTNVFSELRLESNAFHGHGSLDLYGKLWTTSISELNFRMIKVFLPCI